MKTRWVLQGLSENGEALSGVRLKLFDYLHVIVCKLKLWCISFDQLVADVLSSLGFVVEASQKIGKKEHFQNGEQNEQFEQNQRP